MAIRVIYRCSSALLVLFLVACGGTGLDQQTLVAHEETTEARFNQLYTTATVNAEWALATVERSQTQIARGMSQRAGMLATLEARGFDTSVLPGADASPPEPPPSNGDSPDQAGDDFSLATPPPDNAGARGNEDIGVTPFTLPPPEAPDPDAPHLADIVMSAGVGNDDCPVEVTSQFTPNSERIYIVAIANNISPGTELSSEWLRGGEQVAAFDFAPDFRINGACIWFYADQSNFEFTPGNYSVRLRINGQDVGPATPFSITE